MCEDIFDCNVTGQICFENPTFAPDEVCDCSPWFGWTGPECDQASGQVIYTGISMSFYLIWGLILTLLNGRTIFLLTRYADLKQKEKRMKTGAILATVVFGLLSSLSVVINSAIRLSGAIDHNQFQIYEYVSLFAEPEFDVAVTGGPAAASFLLLAVLCYLLCSLVIVSSWMSLLASLDKYFPPLLKLSEDTLKRIIQTIVVISLSFFVILTGLQLIFESTLLVVLLVFIDISIYSVAYYRVYTKYKLYRKSGAETALLDNAVTLIRTCARINISCTLLLIIFLGVYSANVNNYEEILAPGDFNYIVFSLDIVVFFAMFMLSYTCYYAHTVATKYIRKNKSWVPGVSGIVKGLSKSKRNISQQNLSMSQSASHTATLEEVR